MRAALKTQWFHILLTLAGGDRHGAAIVEEVLTRTEGRLRLWPGMLYGSLKQMAEAGLIVEIDPPEGAPSEGGRRRFHRITPEGRRTLTSEVDRLESFVRVARSREG